MEEEVLFNSDTLSKIISYLPSIDVLNLALTCKRFGVSNTNDDSITIEESARIAIQEIASEYQLAALPHYDGESKLADYHYLQLMREPLTFNQLVGAEYVNMEDKSCVQYTDRNSGSNDWGTAVSNNILRAGKHYVTFSVRQPFILLGVMRPGQSYQTASGTPLNKTFFQNYSRTRRLGQEDNNSNIHCCMYCSYIDRCFYSGWEDVTREYIVDTWEGSEIMNSEGEIIGLLLDLDEGTLSVYMNGRKLGVMKKGLEGPYCWAVSMLNRVQVSIKRGTAPP